MHTLPYAGRGLQPPSPTRLLWLVAMTSVVIGGVGASIHLLLLALWYVGAAGPPDSPRPIDLQLASMACLIASFAASIWLLLLGSRTTSGMTAGRLTLRRRYALWIAAQIMVSLAYAALAVMSDRDVWRPPPISFCIEDATLWFSILAAYPLLLIPLVRSRRFGAIEVS